MVKGILKMRILCITGHSDRPEAETFIGLKKRGLDIRVICPSAAPHYSRIKDAGVPVMDMTIRKRVDRDAIRKIRTLIIEHDIRIIHLFNNRAVSNGLIASRGLPVKVIAYRGIVANVGFFNPSSWMTYLNPGVDRVVCVAEAVRRFFLDMRFLWMRLPEEKFVTIYKGHCLSWYQGPPADLTTWGVPRDAFVVGCTANFRPRKGVHVLIEALNHLPGDALVHLVIVGKMDAPKLMKQIENSRFKDQIHVLGFQKNAPEISAACHTVVLPALRREGLPKVVIEAMAYGVAPIVTDSGGSPELIEHHKSGLIVPPGDAKALAGAIMKLYEDRSLCADMGLGAKERIETCFRNEDTIAQTYALYCELMGDSEA